MLTLSITPRKRINSYKAIRNFFSVYFKIITQLFGFRLSSCSGSQRLVLVGAFLVVSLAGSAQLWTRKKDVGGFPRVAAVAFSIGNYGYIGTGEDGTSISYRDFWKYDPSTNSWSQIADFGGTARYGAVGFAIDSFGYVGTGWDGTYTKDFWSYNPGNNAWIRMADFGGLARGDATGFALLGFGYIGTGSGGSYPGYRKDFWRYSPRTNTWVRKADFLGSARTNAVGFAIIDKGYIATGEDMTNVRKDLWQYSPVTDTWVRLPDFPGAARSYAVAFSINTHGYIGTGIDLQRNQFKDIWMYKSETNSWIKQIDFGGTARNAAVAFSVGTKGYIGTGWDGAYKKDFWQFSSGNAASLASDQVTAETTRIDVNVEVMPNPAADFFTVTMNYGNNKLMHLEVIDGTGRIIEKRTGVMNRSIHLGENYAQGIYFLQVWQGDQHVSIKLIKGLK